MKKSLLALAVLAAAGAAQAQVSMYGTVGAGYQNTNTTTDTGTMHNTDNRSSHVIGLKGSEDLGGGLKASFVLEGDFASDRGGFKNDTTGSGGSFGSTIFNRKSYVEVSGSFGSVQFGRTYTADEDLEGYSGMGYNLFDADTPDGKVGGKLPSTVKYLSPSFSGFNVVATTTNAGGTAGTSGTEASGNHNSMSVSYTNGPLFVSAARANQVISASAVGDDTIDVVAAGYKLGALEVRASYHAATIAAADTEYTRLGASYDLGNGVTVIGHIASTSAATAANTKDYLGFAVEKAFSKRTAAYFGYINKKPSSGTETAITSIGIDHKF